MAHLFEPDGHSPCFPWRLPLPHALPHGLPLPHGEEEALWDTQSITNVWKYILLCVECVVDCYAAIPYISQIVHLPISQEEEMNFGGFPAYDKIPYEKRIPGKLHQWAIWAARPRQWTIEHGQNYSQQWWGAQT